MNDVKATGIKRLPYLLLGLDSPRLPLNVLFRPLYFLGEWLKRAEGEARTRLS